MEAPSLHDTERSARLKEETSLTEVEKTCANLNVCSTSALNTHSSTLLYYIFSMINQLISIDFSDPGNCDYLILTFTLMVLGTHGGLVNSTVTLQQECHWFKSQSDCESFLKKKWSWRLLETSITSFSQMTLVAYCMCILKRPSTVCFLKQSHVTFLSSLFPLLHISTVTWTCVLSNIHNRRGWCLLSQGTCTDTDCQQFQVIFYI